MSTICKNIYKLLVKVMSTFKFLKSSYQLEVQFIGVPQIIDLKNLYLQHKVDFKS